MSPIDRREFLRTAAGGPVIIATDPQRNGDTTNTIARQADIGTAFTAPASSITIETPTSLIENVDNLVIVDWFSGGFHISDLLGEKRVNDPVIRVQIDGGTVSRVFPGNFPLNTSKTSTSASGRGIGTPWGREKHAVFALTIVPAESADNVRISVRFRGTLNNGRPREDNQSRTVDVTGRPEGSVTEEFLARAAKNRAQLTDGLGDFINPFNEGNAPKDHLRDAMLTVCWMSTGMLADATVGTVFGVSRVADYVWTGVSQFVSPFEYLLNGHVPGDPTAVEEIEVATYGPPFFSELLSHAEMLELDLNKLELRGKRGRTATILYAISVTAQEEVQAWQNGDDRKARALLGDQLSMIDPSALGNRGANAPSTKGIASRYEDQADRVIEGFKPFLTPTYGDGLLQQSGYGAGELEDLWVAANRVDSQRIKSAVKSIERLMVGETKRIPPLLKFYDRGNIPRTTVPVVEIRSDRVVFSGAYFDITGRITAGNATPWDLHPREGDSLDGETGRFTLHMGRPNSQNYEKTIRFDSNTLRHLAFKIAGGRVDVRQGGETVAEAVSKFERRFDSGNTDEDVDRAATHTIAERKTCSRIETDSHREGNQHSHSHNCTEQTNSFTTSDDAVYLWVKLVAVTTELHVTFQWYSPEGHAGSSSETIPHPNTDGRDAWPEYFTWSWMDLGPGGVPRTPGNWHVDFHVNDAHEFTEEFVITEE